MFHKLKWMDAFTFTFMFFVLKLSVGWQRCSLAFQKYSISSTQTNKLSTKTFSCNYFARKVCNIAANRFYNEKESLKSNSLGRRRVCRYICCALAL